MTRTASVIRASLLLVALALLASTFAVPRARAADSGAIGERIAAATEAFRVATDTEGLEARQAAFQRAAELHEVALAQESASATDLGSDAGHANGALEYNTGNAWFLAGDLGRAIVHYRRAQLLRPGDPQIEANLATARARRRDQLDESAGRAAAETIFFWHRAVGYRTKLWLALIAWLGVCGAGGLLAIQRARTRAANAAGGTRTGVPLRVLIVSALALLAMGGSYLAEASERGARDAAVVVASEVELRTGDGESYPARYENPIHAGAEVTIGETRAGWVEIELPDGKTGWVAAASIERI